jgi:hypothetical protein
VQGLAAGRAAATASGSGGGQLCGYGRPVGEGAPCPAGWNLTLMPKFDYAGYFNRIREIDRLVIPAEKINCGRSRFQAPFTAARSQASARAPVVTRHDR